MGSQVRARVLVLASTVALSVGCGDGLGGELIIETRNGELTFRPRDCASGDRDYFGVEMMDFDTNVVRIVGGDEGPALNFMGNLATFQVVPEDCTIYQGRMERVRTTAVSVGSMSGHLTVECVARSGERITGDLHFEECQYFESDDC